MAAPSLPNLLARSSHLLPATTAPFLLLLLPLRAITSSLPRRTSWRRSSRIGGASTSSAPRAATGRPRCGSPSPRARFVPRALPRRATPTLARVSVAVVLRRALLLWGVAGDALKMVSTRYCRRSCPAQADALPFGLLSRGGADLLAAAISSSTASSSSAASSTAVLGNHQPPPLAESYRSPLQPLSNALHISAFHRSCRSWSPPWTTTPLAPALAALCEIAAWWSKC